MSEAEAQADQDFETSKIDEILEKIDLEYMLQFETQIFIDVVHNDGLVVAAKFVYLYIKQQYSIKNSL